VEEKNQVNTVGQSHTQIIFTEVAQNVRGEVVGLDEDFAVRGVTTLEEAEAGWISFVTSTRHLAQAKQSKASGFLVTAQTAVPGRPCIILDNVWRGMLFLLNHLYPPPAPQSFVHPTAVIGSAVSLGNDVWIGPHVVIEDDTVIGDRTRIGAHCFIGKGCRVGSDVLLHPQVCVLHACEIGNRVILHPGVVIGADGFKYEFIDGQLTKIPQVGRVALEDDVEIGANTCIDRASLTETRIARGAKIDNLVQIAHNVRIGAGSVLCAQVGIAGSARVGETVFMAGQVGVVDNVEIGSRAKIGAQAGVKNNVPEDVYWLGSPAMPAKQFMSIVADWNKLAEMRQRLQEMEARIAALENRKTDK